jgi:phospholipid/cholesterol/gamma-HCH transport system substrate-binding protein
MERNAHYTAVGLVTLVLIIGLAAFVIWLGRMQLDQKYDIYEVVFDNPVRGLSEGGEVHFNGIRVGKVTELRLGSVNTAQVIATVELEGGTPVRTDSRAQLEPQGITGINYIQITPGSYQAPLLTEMTPKNKIPIIPTMPSALTELLQGGGSVLDRALEAMTQVNKVLSDENISSFSRSLENVEALTSELKERQKLLAEAERALTNAADAAEEIKKLSATTRELVEGDAPQTMDKINKASAEIEAAAKDVRRITTKLEAPIEDFNDNALPELKASVVNLNRAAQSMERLAEEARSSPQTLINKGPAEERKVRE